MADENIHVFPQPKEDLQVVDATPNPLSGMNSCVPYVVAYDILPGTKVIFINAIEGLLWGLALRGDGNVDAISRMVFNVASALAKMGGNDEDDMKYMKEVVDYMNQTHYLARTRLHVHFLLQCAMLYQARGSLDNALGASQSAQNIASTVVEMEDLEIEAWKVMINIYVMLGHEQELHTARLSFLNLSEHKLSLTTSMESLCNLGVVCYTVGRVEDGRDYLIEALKIEGEGEIDPQSATRSHAFILLKLSEYYFHWAPDKFSQQAALLLVEQAIAGFQQVECTCSTDYIDLSSSWGGTGTTSCGCHQVLADAWELQGHIYQKHGFHDKAEKSYKRGLTLAIDCNDAFRTADFHLVLANLYFSMSHGNIEFGLLNVESTSSQYAKLFEKMGHHINNFLKASKPGASLLHDQMALFYHHEDLHGSEASTNIVSARAIGIHKMLSMSEKRGHFDRHAMMYACLCTHFARIHDFKACKENFFLALKFLRSVPSSEEKTLCRQYLGQFAMEPYISELDIAEELWHEVIHEAEEMLQNLAKISEDHALRYFEVRKHANMVMAKCQMIRAKESQSSDMVQAYVEKALVWAERGKGRMLLSHLAATQKTNQSRFENVGKVDDGTSSCMLNPRSTTFESEFLSNDVFALDFILNRGSTPSKPLQKKTIFVEYTFIDYKSLLVHIIVDGSASVHFGAMISLPTFLDKQTQLEAEKELAMHKRSDNNAQTESSSRTKMDISSNQDLRELQQKSTRDTTIDKVVLAMDKYATNRVPFNPWIPGIVAGIVRQAIEAQLKRKRKQNCHNEVRKINELLQSLYDVLIKPIEKNLFEICNPGDTIVFVPHEDLGVVPFAALHKSGGKYLIEQYAIFVSMSMWSSKHCQNLYEEKVHSRYPEGPAVLVGRRTGYPPGWRNLSKAHEEVDIVTQEFGSTSVFKVLDNTPDSSAHMKEKVMEVLPEASWIHLCVHGEISPQFPQGSFLLGDTDDQRLTAGDIIRAATSPWRARAVVASACQTGLGAVAGGGIHGFVRSFILAGVPSCILAMWEVNESFCAEFMHKLYNHLKLGEHLAQAIHATILYMMQDLKKARKSRTPNIKSNVMQDSVLEPKWSILDWAAFAGFGYQGVVLPKVTIESKGVD